MSYTEQQLNKLTESAVAKILETEFRLQVPAAATKAEMVQAVLAAQAEESQDSAIPAVIPPSPPIWTTSTVSSPNRRLRLIVHNQEGVENTPFVKVGVNGVMYQLPREKELEVPEAVVNVLRDAVIDKFEPGADGSGTQLTKVRRFPFTVLGEAA